MYILLEINTNPVLRTHTTITNNYNRCYCFIISS